MRRHWRSAMSVFLRLFFVALLCASCATTSPERAGNGSAAAEAFHGRDVQPRCPARETMRGPTFWDSTRDIVGEPLGVFLLFHVPILLLLGEL